MAKIARDLGLQREAEERFRVLVEQRASGMCVVDERGLIVMVNPAMERLFGYGREELLGKPIEILLPASIQGAHATLREGYQRAMETRAMGKGRDLHGRRKDGSEIAVEIGLSPISAGGARGVLCVVVDITARKQAHAALTGYAKKLEASNAELATFAYVVSHDIKAPLRGIASVAEWIAADFGDKVDADARENLGLMLKRTHRLSALIEGILTYSRAGRTEGVPAMVDSRALCLDIVASLVPPPHIQVEISPDLPMVPYDETQLRQILQNLINNAMTHLGKPSGRIRVSATSGPDEWEFRVQDDGVGIAERHFRRIFELFQTLKPKDECGTTGAGRAIVKRLVERNGGSIRVESVEGEGATFVFTVVRRRSATAPRTATLEATP